MLNWTNKKIGKKKQLNKMGIRKGSKPKKGNEKEEGKKGRSENYGKMGKENEAEKRNRNEKGMFNK